MAYQPIAWNKKQRKQIAKTVRNYNSRLKTAIKNAEKAGKDISALPEKMTVAKAKEMIGTRKDLQKLTKSLENFTAKTAEIVTNVHGVQATIWEIQETRKRVRAENRRRAAESMKKKPVYSQGVEITGAEMMSRKNENKPITTDFTNVTKQTSWENLVKHVESFTEKRRGEYNPQIYIKEINAALDSQGIFDSDIRAMYNAIGDKILNSYNADNMAQYMSFIYDENVDTDGRKSELREGLFNIIHELSLYKEFFTELQKLTVADESIVRQWKHKGYKNTFEMLKNDIDIFDITNFKKSK